MYNNVVNDKKKYSVFNEIEAVRKSLKKNHNTINYQDYGSGHQSGIRRISSIASKALSYPYQCRVMFRLIEHLELNNILELGTSLGISTLYLSSARKESKVYTLEGDTGSYSMATHIFHQLKKKNIYAKLGVFEDTLEATLKTMTTVDFAFIDGHHDEASTLNYFDQIKSYCKNDSVVVIDDINWSKGMSNAWEAIKKMPEVSLSIDLFFCGLVFFRKEHKEKEDFKIRPDKILFHL